MTAQWTAVIAAFVALIASLGTTAVNIFFGERWKTRYAQAKENQDKAKALLDHYSEPLVRAAFELQSRLYNIVRGDFLYRNASLPYAELSTLWLIGQWFAWNEILRREIQLLELGYARRTADFQRKLMAIADLFASAKEEYKEFQVRRAEQRAIGELLVVPRQISGGTRSDAMGYAQFCAESESEELAPWLTQLRVSISKARQVGKYDNSRVRLVQRDLIDLIDYLDKDHVRFPDPNERGKLPKPESGADAKRERPKGEIARFRIRMDEPNPLLITTKWLKEQANNKKGRQFTFNESGYPLRVEYRPASMILHRCIIEVQHSWINDQRWVEVSAWLDSRSTNATGDSRISLKSHHRRLRRAQRHSIAVVNGLLEELGRPKMEVPTKFWKL